MYTVTSNYKTVDHNVTVYTNNVKRHLVFNFFFLKCISLYHGQSFVKKFSGIHFMYIYTIAVVLEVLEIVLHISILIFYFQCNLSCRARNVL